MKKFSSILFSIVILLAVSTTAFSGDGDKIKLNDRISSEVDLMKERFDKDYDIEKTVNEVRSGKKLIDFYIDLQLGYGSTSANIDSKNSSAAYNTSSAGGFNVGGLFYLNIADAFSFSSGLDFLNKKFEVSNIDTAIAPPGSVEEISTQALNIPINFNIGGMITDKFGLTFNGGPYLGIVLSADDKAGLGYKDFDLGLNGTLTGNYMVAPLISVLLGTKFQYGGLNNLGSTDNVESIHTTNFTVFSGVRFGL